MAKVSALILGLLMSLLVFAQENQMALGKVDFIESSYNSVVIDDAGFKFALNAKVFDLKGKATNRYAIKAGDIVRYELAQGANGYNQVANVWLMPAGTKIERGGQD